MTAEEKENRKILKKAELQLLKATYLSTGSSVLNMACSGSPHGGFKKGTYVFLVGDSSSGKTFLSMTCLAEAVKNPHFADYRFIYDNIENGMMMDVEKFFGQTVQDKLEPPKGTQDNPIMSASTEDFYYNLDTALQEKKPFIYILDSMDGIVAQDDQDKFQEKKKASKEGKETTGSYGTAKAKGNSEGLRLTVPRLQETGSILIIISQTRDNLGFGFEKKTRSGGKALKFYCHLELWSSVKGAIKKTFKGKDRPIGIEAIVDIKKNRYTGWMGKTEMSIYRSFGIDDTGSLIDFLVEEKYWEKSKTSIVATELGVTLTREALIAHVDSNNLLPKLRTVTKKAWDQIEDGIALKRPKKYE